MLAWSTYTRCFLLLRLSLLCCYWFSEIWDEKYWQTWGDECDDHAMSTRAQTTETMYSRCKRDLAAKASDTCVMMAVVFTVHGLRLSFGPSSSAILPRECDGCGRHDNDHRRAIASRRTRHTARWWDETMSHSHPPVFYTLQIPKDDKISTSDSTRSVAKRESDDSNHTTHYVQQQWRTELRRQAQATYKIV